MSRLRMVCRLREGVSDKVEVGGVWYEEIEIDMQRSEGQAGGSGCKD